MDIEANLKRAGLELPPVAEPVASYFAEQHKVANGASELIGEVLGEAGIHARAAVGVAALPLHAPVEVELLATVTP